jgi:indole-3-glycerol phosphate synthase
MGADCILLIAACLDDAQMAELEAIAAASTWRCWWKCTTRDELQRALKLKTPLVGINNRNLRTFEVSLDTTLGMLADVPADRLLVTESGILGRKTCKRMRAAGVHAFLVGEAFMRARAGRSAGRAVRRLIQMAHRAARMGAGWSTGPAAGPRLAPARSTTSSPVRKAGRR